jgi:hypothetical protein
VIRLAYLACHGLAQPIVPTLLATSQHRGRVRSSALRFHFHGNIFPQKRRLLPISLSPDVQDCDHSLNFKKSDDVADHPSRLSLPAKSCSYASQTHTADALLARYPTSQPGAATNPPKEPIMVLILHQYPRSLDSFSPPSTSSSSDTPVDWASPSSSSTDTLAQTGFSSQWNRLPLQQERVALQSRTTVLPVHSDTSTNSRNAPATTQKSALQINTAVFSRLDYSSTSSMSASTMTSDPPSSIDTDAEDASNGTDRDIVPKTEDEGESGIEEIRRLDSSESPDVKGHLVMRNTSNTKKRRGRPRKNPQPSFIAGAKQPKGRSKTGCLTCRRRKKKCDENKPSCTLHLSAV